MEKFQVGLLFVYLEQVMILEFGSLVLSILSLNKKFCVDFAKYYNKSHLTRSRDQPSGNSERR